MKSFFILRENQQITEAITVSRADFEKLKKGDKITITYDSSIRKGTTTTFTVKGKSRSAKYNVDKISMSADGKMGKYFLYSRDGKDATLALGDMAATIQKYVKESVELDEASREDKIKQTIKIMKKYPANKGKSEKELRKGAIAYLDQKKESVDEAKTGLPTGQSTVDYENSIQKLMKTLKKDPKNKGKSGNELRKLATFKLTGHKLKESIDEAKVRGADAYDKTFANRKQADKFAREMGGRVKQVGRVFYVFKEEVDEASILRTKTTRKQSDASKEKDRKKAVKTFQDIRKGKYPGVKIGEETLDEADILSKKPHPKGGHILKIRTASGQVVTRHLNKGKVKTLAVHKEDLDYAKESLDEKKSKGLWHNIHQKRKRGERPAKPGEKGYPKTLDIDEDDASGLSVKKGHKLPVSKGAGLTKKGVAAYRRKNPGSKLQTAVTTKPSKLDPDSKAAKRRKSFCARSRGWTGERGKAARRRWNC